jgi:hypothetical protein
MGPTELGGDYSIHKIVWDFGDDTFLVRWNDYTHVHDTREPREHVPEKFVTSYRRSLMVDSINVRQPLHYLLQSFALQLTSRKILERDPVYLKTVPVPELSITQVGIAVLKYLSKFLGLKMEKDGNEWTLQVANLDKVGELLQLQVRGVGNGALRINCGQGSYEDMMMVWFVELKVKESSSLGGSFKYSYSSVAFNGRSGEPRWPIIPDGWEDVSKDPAKEKWVYKAEDDMRLSDGEAEALVSHAKASLAQPWVINAVTNRLREEGRWHQLPAGKWALAQALANPTIRARKKRAIEPPPEPKRKAKKQEWRGRDERAKRGRVT